MTDATGDFVAQWLAFEPEGRLVGNFLDPREREICFISSALLFALEDAALRIAEPTVSAAKLAWWQDELVRAARHAARHPLTSALAGTGASDAFEALSAPLVALNHHESASDDAALEHTLSGWVAAQVRLATALHGGSADAWPVEVIRRGFLLRRLRELGAQAELGRLWVPLDLMAAERIARQQLAGPNGEQLLSRARRSMARRLLMKDPSGQPMHRVAAMQNGLQRLRLEWMSRSGGDRLPPLRALWRTWRAART